MLCVLLCMGVFGMLCVLLVVGVVYVGIVVVM